jgi:hypothetical protein
MVADSNNAFSPTKVHFGVSLKKIEFTRSITPENRQKDGVVYGFPAKLGESTKTHISVKSRDIDTKIELYVKNKAYTTQVARRYWGKIR